MQYCRERLQQNTVEFERFTLAKCKDFVRQRACIETISSTDDTGDAVDDNGEESGGTIDMSRFLEKARSNNMNASVAV